MNYLKKFTSRKFLAAVAGVIAGLAMAFGLNEGITTTVSGAVMAVGSVIAYIVTEGRIDAEAVGDAAQKVQDAIDAVKKEDDVDA